MATLSPTGRDRTFFLGLGITSVAIVWIMKRMLLHYRDSVIIPVRENKPQYITQKVEDSLKLSTLDKLLDCTNYSIKETTVIIICERALYDGSTVDRLLWCITRPDYNMREKGIRALTMIVNQSTVRLLDVPKTYAALVKSLEYSVTDYKHNECDSDWDNWYLRDVIEQGCLILLIYLVHECGVSGLVKSRFVERWLVKEPWPGTTVQEKQKKFLEYMGQSKKLNELINPLSLDINGRLALQKVELLASTYDFGKGSSGFGGANASEDTARFDLFLENRRRRQGQTQEGNHMRRRNREAMVLNDGTRPFGQSDIFERQQ